MSSNRLPTNVMKSNGCVLMIELLLKRLAKYNELDQLVFASEAYGFCFLTG
jgi:spore coat polysaccharide biosynthesis protein SpsF (cytidylyltransferase family)